MNRTLKIKHVAKIHSQNVAAVHLIRHKVFYRWLHSALCILPIESQCL